MSRAERAADAAVTVLARDGLRGLTHRAVDTQAGLPAGSTSNYFRTRAALLTAVVERLETLDREVYGVMAPPDPDSRLAVASYLTGIVLAMTTAPHVRATRARVALLLDETARPALTAGHRRFRGEVEKLLMTGGHEEPHLVAAGIADLLDGALVHAVSGARPIEAEQLTRVLMLLLA